MPDRLFFPALVALAILMIAVAMVWPQGLGDQSPGPFGHTPAQQTPAMKAAMKRESEASNQRLDRAKQTVTDLQARTIAPTQ